MGGWVLKGRNLRPDPVQGLRGWALLQCPDGQAKAQEDRELGGGWGGRPFKGEGWGEARPVGGGSGMNWEWAVLDRNGAVEPLRAIGRGLRGQVGGQCWSLGLGTWTSGPQPRMGWLCRSPLTLLPLLPQPPEGPLKSGVPNPQATDRYWC